MTDSIENSANTSQRGAHLFCAYCGTEDKTDFGYCDHCGEKVAELDKDRFSSHELGKCQICSADNQIRARHCMGCGISLDEKPLIQSGSGPMNSSLRDAVYPDPPDPNDPPTPSQVSTAEPEERRDNRRAPPYAKSDASQSRREQVDSWGNADTREAERSPDSAEFGDRDPAPVSHEEHSEFLDDEEFNDSGTTEAQLPPELKGYNWGALLLGPIWGVGNRTWIATILFVLWIVPITPAVGLPLYLLGSLYLGSHANRWAWQSKKWGSTYHFKRAQQNWAFWGFIISPIIVFSILTVPLWSGS